MFLDQDNKGKLVPASFFLLFRTLMREKLILIKKCVIAITVTISLHYKLIKLFYLLFSCERVTETSN